MITKLMPSPAARAYWVAVTGSALVLIVLVYLREGSGRGIPALVLTTVIWTAGLLGHWAVSMVARNKRESPLAQVAAGGFSLLPAVGFMMLIGGLLGNPLLDLAYLSLWGVGFVSFAMLLALMIINSGG
jgi:hypothetical protein